MHTELIRAVKSAKLMRWLRPEADVQISGDGEHCLIVSYNGTPHLQRVDAFLFIGFNPWKNESDCQLFRTKIMDCKKLSAIYCRHIAKLRKPQGSYYEPEQMADALYATLMEARR